MMRRVVRGTALLALLVAAPLAAQGAQLVITVDDLPFVGAGLPVAEQARLTDSLLAAFRKYKVPAIGFVNERRLEDTTGTVDPARVAMLQKWLRAGLELGNHTWSHPDLHTTPLADFEADFLKGERVTRGLLAKVGKAPRFFRHPFLHTGQSLAVHDSLLAFLALHRYRVAPVTMDNHDYIYAEAFHRARLAGDTALARRVQAAYLDYMESVVLYYEKQARAIVGRAFPQVLLTHASALNALTFPQLFARLQRLGYSFVPLDKALEDPVYDLPDRYVGTGGITWLHRWGMVLGLPPGTYAGEPEVPAWVQQAAAR